jgi:hypothetical protein
LRKTPFFHRKLAKITENCDHNIDPLIDAAIFIVRICWPKFDFRRARGHSVWLLIEEE